MIATPSPVEQALAEVEGGDMSPTKERNRKMSGTDDRAQLASRNF
jgi:hypothetical protein